MTSAVPTSTIAPNAADTAMRPAPHGEARVPFGRDRTLVVVAAGSELAVALRDHLDRARVTVAEARPEEAAAAVHACRPWPWMVAGEGGLDAEASALLTALPVAVLWRGELPPGLALRARSLPSFAALAAAVEAALASSVAGMRLAVGSGVVLPDGGHAGCAPLEALVTAFPEPVRLTPRHLARVSAVLRESRARVRVAAGARGVSLVDGD